jgi:hypothetical protein
MAINAQSERGIIRLFNDFCGVANYVSLTNDTAPAGDFYMGGESFEVATAGAAYLQSDALSGVVRLTTDTTDKDTIFIGTDISFDVALMAPIVVEARVRFSDLDAKAAFVGLTSILTLDEQMDDIIDYSAGTTVTLTATLAGFFLSSEFTDDEDWHMVYNGGTTTGETTTTSIDADDDAVAGEWQVLRLEVDPNGTCRWYIDGVLKQTVAGAISTTTDLAVCCGVTANTTTAAVMDVDYLLVEANRDWNA